MISRKKNEILKLQVAQKKNPTTQWPTQSQCGTPFTVYRPTTSLNLNCAQPGFLNFPKSITTVYIAYKYNVNL